MKGWQQHRQAVDALQASYNAIEAGSTVRLAKKTSNLFRPRSATVQGLDVNRLDGVIQVDPRERIADVQGMCTYEDLVDATLPYGLIPYVVPQLRTITLGGAVTGLGIESTSFRNGLPHESVTEMDIMTGDGAIVEATPDNDHADLFYGFPNSYGSLGYATRLRIRLEAVPRYVRLRHIGFDDAKSAAAAIEQIVTDRAWDDVRVDGLDGTAFSPGEIYLTLAEFTDDVSGPASDYTGTEIYYTSIRQRDTDVLTMYDYLWRWDTDWFWCSAAFGAQKPLIRRLWPRRWRRSDVYHKLVGLDRRYDVIGKIDRFRGVEARERVIQDVEVDSTKLADFLEWFDEHVGMRPVWICPLRITRSWPLYPLEVGQTYVNLGFWGTVQVPANSPPGYLNRQIEAEVSRLGGHKSLYSEAFYDRETFEALYGGQALVSLRARYDPQSRLTNLYDKAVRNT